MNQTLINQDVMTTGTIKLIPPLLLLFFVNLANSKNQENTQAETATSIAKEAFANSFESMNAAEDLLEKQWVEDLYDEAFADIKTTPFIESKNQWRLGFITSLLNENASPILQAIAINYLTQNLTEPSDFKYDDSIDLISEKLESIFRNHKQTKEVYSVLYGTCEKPQFKPICLQSHFYSEAKSNDPHNLFSYAQGLDLANHEIKSEVLKTNHAHSYHFTGILELRDAMNLYHKNIPMPINFKEHENFTFKYLTHDEKNNISVAYEQNSPQSHINLESSMLLYHDFYTDMLRQLNKKCTDKAHNQACQHIADLLINKTDNYFNQNFGHMIQRATYKASFSDQKLHQSAINHLRLKQNIACLTRQTVGMFGSFVQSHPVAIDVFINNIENTTELNVLRLSLVELQKYLTNNNLDALDSFEECELINNLTNKDFIGKYKLEDDLVQMVH